MIPKSIFTVLLLALAVPAMAQQRGLMPAQQQQIAGQCGQENPVILVNATATLNTGAVITIHTALCLHHQDDQLVKFMCTGEQRCQVSRDRSDSKTVKIEEELRALRRNNNKQDPGRT